MQPPDDPALLRRLLERMTGAPLLVGALPPRLPLELPLPSDTTVIGSVVHPAFQHPDQPDTVLQPERATVYLDVAGTPIEVHAYFVGACRAAGWTVLTIGRQFPPSGTRVTAIPINVNAQGPDGRYLNVTIRPEGDGRCDVRLDFGAAPPRMGDFSRDLFTKIDRILMDRTGPGGSIFMHGGSGSDTWATAEATATGFTNAAAVEATVSVRCLAAGWTRLSAGGDQSFVWSRWSLPEGNSRWALLVVAEGSSPGHASITLRAEESPSDDDKRQNAGGFALTRSSFMVATGPSFGADAAALSPSSEAENAIRVACPRCGDVPSAAAVWSCYPGCQTSWNTFNTRGRCPGCGKRWTETMCLACGATSPHDAWYLAEDEAKA